MSDPKTEAYGIARWFVIAIVVRWGWEAGGWVWVRLIG